MKNPTLSPLSWLIIAIWSVVRLINCARALLLIALGNDITHLGELTLFFPSLFTDTIFGIISLVSLFIGMFKYKSFLLVFYISMLLNITASIYILYAHYYVHYNLGIENFSHIVIQVIWVLFSWFILYLVSKNRNRFMI